MARSRSPNYPSISLKEAIEKARSVYSKDHRNKMHREVVAKHLGYSGLNGASLTMLSALLKYGLLEGRGDEIRVSDPAVTILVDPPDSAERKEALKAAAMRPPLFSELVNQFGGQVPSEENLTAYLQKRGFKPSAAAAAAQAFRDTMELAGVGDNVQNDGVDKTKAIQPNTPPPPPRGGETHVFSWPLAKGVSAELRVTVQLGAEIKPDHFERLNSYVGLAKAALEDGKSGT
jgi:hypothetical protein